MTWFKNITAYELTEPVDVENMELHLVGEMTAGEIEKVGWSEIFTGETMVKTSGAYMVRLRKNKKNIPSAVIKDMTDERIAKLESEGVEKISKKEVKAEVIHQLAKTAQIVPSFVNGYIDNKNLLLVIDTSSAAQSDLFIETLHRAVDFKAELLMPEQNMVDLMTGWVINKTANEPFTLQASCELTDMEGGSGVTYKNQDLSSDEIQSNLENGKRVSKLSLDWNERFSFTLTDEFNIKSIKPLSSMSDIADEMNGEDGGKETAYLTDTLLMVEDFAEMLGDLLKQEQG
jgi:recombination associated protein RdgC